MARREVAIREKTLYRVLYETATRTEEVLGLNIEDFDLAGRRAPVKAKGTRVKSRRHGQAREDVVLEIVYWDAGTARLLPRLLSGRVRGPVFCTHRCPGPGKVLGPRDRCPATGLARQSYGQARALLGAHTRSRARAPDGTCTNCATRRCPHLGGAGASLLLLTAKSRHKKPENVRRYFKPSAEVTSLLAPGDNRR